MNATPSTLPCTSSTMAAGVSAKAGAARQHAPTTAPIRLFMGNLIQFDRYLPGPRPGPMLSSETPRQVLPESLSDIGALYQEAVQTGDRRKQCAGKLLANG